MTDKPLADFSNDVYAQDVFRIFRLAVQMIWEDETSSSYWPYVWNAANNALFRRGYNPEEIFLAPNALAEEALEVAPAAPQENTVEKEVSDAHD